MPCRGWVGLFGGERFAAFGVDEAGEVESGVAGEVHERTSQVQRDGSVGAVFTGEQGDGVVEGGGVAVLACDQLDEREACSRVSEVIASYLMLRICPVRNSISQNSPSTVVNCRGWARCSSSRPADQRQQALAPVR